MLHVPQGARASHFILVVFSQQVIGGALTRVVTLRSPCWNLLVSVFTPCRNSTFCLSFHSVVIFAFPFPTVRITCRCLLKIPTNFSQKIVTRGKKAWERERRQYAVKPRVFRAFVTICLVRYLF